MNIQKSLLFTLLSSLTIIPHAQAKPFAAACTDLVACIQAVSALTGDHYLYDSELKRSNKVTASANVELTTENADLLLSDYLRLNQESRVPTGQKGTYLVMRDNDAKGSSVPSYQASMTQDPGLPNSWDMVRLDYKMSHPESVKEVENIVRTYVDMGARIYGVETSGILIITTHSLEIKNVLSLIRANDVRIDPAVLKAAKEADERRENARMQLQNSKNSSPH